MTEQPDPKEQKKQTVYVIGMLVGLFCGITLDLYIPGNFNLFQFLIFYIAPGLVTVLVGLLIVG